MAPLAPLIPLVLFAQVSTGTVTRTSATVEARVASGTEWDTNAERAVSQGTTTLLALRNLEVAGDALVRVTGSVSGRVAPTSNTSLWAGYQLGAKRFFNKRTEDFLTHQFLGQAAWSTTRWLSLGVSGSFRLTRIRNELRDYNVGGGEAFVQWAPSDDLSFRLSGGFTGFRFLSDDHFDYRGPSVGASTQYRLFDRFFVSGRVTHYWRNFARNGLVLGTSAVTGAPVGPTFCDSPADELANLNVVCSPVERDDTEVDVSAAVRYFGAFQIGVEYRLRAQRSTSPYENIDRHRLNADTTFAIVGPLTATVLASIRVGNGTSVNDSLQQSEDDANRNSLSVQLRYAITETLSVSLRYAIYINQFSTNDASYRRQLFYLGVGYRTGVIALD